MKKETVKIKVKHFDTPEGKRKAERAVKAQGLKKFNSMAFQHNMIPEGVYTVDLSHVFDNQYNTVKKDGHNGYRIFEYCEMLTNTNGVRPMGRGYYIARGIDKLRAYQKRVKVCGYCGAQYIDSTQKWCNKCTGSEYLTPDYYKLLKLVPVLDKNAEKYEDALPQKIRDKIKRDQLKARTVRLQKEKQQKLESIARDIEHSKLEFKAFKWLIAHDIDYKNCIYYSHTNEFCFGWRDSLSDAEKEALAHGLKDFPYKYTMK